MNQTYARGGRDDTAVGGIILTMAASVSAILVILGLIYGTGASQRHDAEMTAFGCEPSVYISGLPCTTEQMLVSDYEAIVDPATKQLNTDLAAYAIAEGHNLTAAEAVLTAEVATEQALDNNLAAATFTPQNRARALALITSDAGTPLPLAAVTFTPQITVIADALIRANQARVTLTAEQARTSSLTRMRSLNGRVEAASTAVHTEMKLLLKAINTPPQWS
jgi:hypothetical protein